MNTIEGTIRYMVNQERKLDEMFSFIKGYTEQIKKG